MLSLLWIPLFLASAYTAQAATSYSLKEAVRYALEHSPSLSSDNQRERIAELAESNATSKFFPSLDVTSTHGVEKESPKKSTDPWVSSLNLSASENLYDNGQSLTQHKIARLGHDIASLTFQRNRQKLTLDVVVQFYRYSVAHALAEVKRQQSGIFSQQYEVVSGQYKQGLRTKREFLRLKSQAQRGEIDLQDSLIEVDRTRVELARLMGLSSSEAEFKEVSIDTLPKTIPQKKPEVEQTLDYRIASAKRNIAPEQLSLAERNYWPQVYLTTGVNYDNSGYLGGGSTQTYGWNALLAIKYNLWDWGIKRREMETARRNALISDNDLTTARQSTIADISNVMLDLKQRQNNFKAAKNLLEIEETNYGLLKRDYESGKVTSYDLILNLNDLLGARVLFYTAQFGLAEGVARYQFYDGNLYEALSIE